MVEAKGMNKMIDKPGARLSSADDRKHVEEMLKQVSMHLGDTDFRSLKLARKACEDFFKLLEYFEDVPTTKQAQNTLSDLHETGMSFYEALDGLNPFMKKILTDEYALCEGSENAGDLLAELDEMPRLSLGQLARLKSSVAIIATLAGQLQESFESKKMEPNRPRRGFIKTMATVYEKSIGRPAKSAVHCDNARTEGKFGGRFFELVWDCLVAAGAKPHSQRALYNDIYKTLNDRKPLTNDQALDRDQPKLGKVKIQLTCGS